METLIIPVDCRPFARDGPPQLGITVEAPYSQQRVLQQQKKLSASAKESYQNHDYQNLDKCNLSLTNTNGGSTKLTVDSRSNNIGHSSLRNNSKQHIANVFNGTQPSYEGLQITQIQPGSVIDCNGQFKIGDIIVECNGVNLQRPFPEAQRTLKQFVVEHTSHGPLVMKVLRRAASSSSIQSTTGSQITVIEKKPNYSQESQQNSTAIDNFKPRGKPQQVVPSTSDSQTSQKSLSSSVKDPTGFINTRKIGIKHAIKLKKDSIGGFGIKIAERDNMHCTKNRPICITAITTSGSAYRDGRLREGDMLMEVNGYDLRGKSQPEVTKMLKAVRPDEEVEFVVSRQEVAIDDETSNLTKSSIENDCDRSLIDLDLPENDDSVFESSTQEPEKNIDNLLNLSSRDEPGVHVYDIPLNDTKSAGLGLYLKYPRRADERKDLGIWIEKVITGGAAWKDGRLQPDDQILAINGINLIDLSNAEASETLTAAVCRGIGPEATPNIIRLQIHRRDPSVVSKILKGTNNRIECSDIVTNSRDGPVSIFSKNVDNSCDSYQTALEVNNHNRSVEYKDSSESSNQNSQSDSAMSPQTQASNSIRLMNSYNNRSDQNSSDKTNETTSSAISQISNSTSNVMDVPVANEFDQQNCDNHLATEPKSIYTDINNDLKIVNCTPSSQSLDDDSTDATGEERFQRDGFSRRSFYEKKNVPLYSKDTEAFKRNLKLQDEKEQQRQLEEQMSRQRLDDDRRRSYHQIETFQRLPASYNTDQFKSIYGLQTSTDRTTPGDQMLDTYHREVPVDVHPSIDPKIEVKPLNCRQTDQFVPYNDRSRISDTRMMSLVNQANHMQSVIFCRRCGLNSPCLCGNGTQVHPHDQSYVQGHDFIFKRSNSLESIQQHQSKNNLVVPRSGTVRVARNRKVDGNFVAPVDRSYEISTNGSNSRQNYSDLSENRRASASTKMSNSVANSTTSTYNDERHLIGGSNVVTNGTEPVHKKSSSLLTKFLKFGSIKRKKKNRKAEETSSPNEIKSITSKSSRDSQRSHSSRNSHARTHSSQSHPNLINHQCENLTVKLNSMSNGQQNGQVLDHSVMPLHNHIANYHQNGLEISSHQLKPSSLLCQQQYQMAHNNNNTHYNKVPSHSNNIPITMVSKHAQNMTTRPQLSNNPVGHRNPQYSHPPLQSLNQQHHSNALATGPAGPMMMSGLAQDPGLYTSGRSQMMVNTQQSNSALSNNDYPHTAAHRQWHSSHFQTTNGLWVTSPPESDSHIHQSSSLYGSVPHHPNSQLHAASMTMHRPQIHQHQGIPLNQQTANLNGYPPYLRPINSNPNGMLFHGNQLSQSHNQVPFNTLQPPRTLQNHHHQPQQIYYYDF